MIPKATCIVCLNPIHGNIVRQNNNGYRIAYHPDCALVLNNKRLRELAVELNNEISRKRLQEETK